VLFSGVGRVIARNDPLLFPIFLSYHSLLRGGLFLRFSLFHTFLSYYHFPFWLAMRKKVWSKDFEENCVQVLRNVCDALQSVFV
jgi:hypothetical protein